MKKGIEKSPNATHAEFKWDKAQKAILCPFCNAMFQESKEEVKLFLLKKHSLMKGDARILTDAECYIVLMNARSMQMSNRKVEVGCEEKIHVEFGDEFVGTSFTRLYQDFCCRYQWL